MNPNLIPLFRSILKIVLVFGGVGLAVFAGIKMGYFTGGGMMETLLDAIFVFTMIVVVGAMAGVMLMMFSELFRNMINRADRVDWMAFDQNNHGVHLFTSGFRSGGEDGDAYRKYLHYYYELPSGKVKLAKPVYHEKEFTETMDELRKKTGLDLFVGKKEGAKKNGEEGLVLKNDYHSIETQPFSSLFGFDKGIEIKCSDSQGNVLWKRRI